MLRLGRLVSGSEDPGGTDVRVALGRSSGPGHWLDAVWSGRAYSAPLTMLTTQLWAIRRLGSRPDDLSRRVLGLLGVLNGPGFLAERSVRAHLRPGGWDPIKTPVVATALGLAVAMGVLGHQERSGR